MSAEKGKKELDVSDIVVRQDNVRNLVSSWMDDTLGLSDSENEGDEDEKNQEEKEEEEEEETEVRMPRVGLGAEAKAERGAWKKSEAAAEKLDAGARGVADRLVRQTQRSKSAGEGSSSSSGASLAIGTKRLGGIRSRNDEEDDDGDSRFGSIMKLSAKKKKKEQKGGNKDAVTMIMEQKQKKRERKAAAKAAKASAKAEEELKESEKKKEKETETEPKQQQEEEAGEEAAPPPEKKQKTGEAFADGDDFISLPPAEDPAPAWKNKKNKKTKFHGEGKPTKERYVRPENVPQRSAKIRFEKGQDGQMRKRTKTRSKQKNLRRDHRPLEKKPNTIPIPPQNSHKTFADDDD